MSNQTTITVRAVDTVGGALKQAVDSGANRAYGLSFMADEPSVLQDKRVLGLCPMPSCAQNLAALTGIQARDLVSIIKVVGSPEVVACECAAVGQAVSGQAEVNMIVQMTCAIHQSDGPHAKPLQAWLGSQEGRRVSIAS